MDDRVHHRYKKIEDWYRKNPHLGVGIACGPSNLFVLDIDIKKDKGDAKKLKL